MRNQEVGAPAFQVDTVQAVVRRGERQRGRVRVVGVTDDRAAVVHARVVQAQRGAAVGAHRRHRCLQGARGAAAQRPSARHHPPTLPAIVGQLLAVAGVDPVQHAALLQVEGAGFRQRAERAVLRVHQADAGAVLGHWRPAVEVGFERQVAAPGAVPDIDPVVTEEVVRRPRGEAARKKLRDLPFVTHRFAADVCPPWRPGSPTGRPPGAVMDRRQWPRPPNGGWETAGSNGSVPSSHFLPTGRT